MRRLLKWGVVVLVLAEVYARGGREFLFGSRDEDGFGVGETIRAWVDLPDVWDPRLDTLSLPRDIADDNGNVIGAVTKVRRNPDARDRAGYPRERAQVYAEANRAALGFPINVALAQLGDYTRKAVGIG